MKKIITLAVCTVMILSCLLGNVFMASAAGLNQHERAVVDKLSTKVKGPNGWYGFPEQYVKMGENFFNQYPGLTEEQKNLIIPYLDDAFQVFKDHADDIGRATYIFDIRTMHYVDRKRLLDNGIAAGKVVGLTITYENRRLKAVDENGYIWLDADPIIKVTGETDKTMNAILYSGAIAAVVLLAGASVFVFKMKSSKSTISTI